MNKTIFELELHETKVAEVKAGIRHDVTRVPSGWLYQPIRRNNRGDDDYGQPVFVPFPEEQIFTELKQENE